MSAWQRCYNAYMTDANRQIERLVKLADKGKGDDTSLHIVPDHFVDLASNRFRLAESYERRRLLGSLTATNADDVQFEDGRFLSVDLSKTRWQKLLLHQIRMESCDLANAHWTNGILDTSEMHKCRATGFQFIDSKSTNCLFRQSKLSLAAFHGSKFCNDRFEDCDLSEANFEGAELVDVVFRSCDLRLARFPNCVLRNVDFRGSHLAEIQIDVAKLRGLIVDAVQLPDIAETLGLIVKTIADDER